MRLNCRKHNKCIFCKYWLGLPPTVEYRTGDVIDVPNKGLCSRDKKTVSIELMDYVINLKKEV